MRILTAVSRRGIEMPYVHASAAAHGYRASLLLDVNTKQIGQLCRDWYAIVDVMDVSVGVPTPEMLDSAAGLPSGHPPASASASGDTASAAMA
jgi:hypothetical protein